MLTRVNACGRDICIYGGNMPFRLTHLIFGMCQFSVFVNLLFFKFYTMLVSSEESKELLGAITIFLYIYNLYCVKILI